MARNSNERVYWFRQALIVFTIMVHAWSMGFCLAFPSILNPALLDPSTTDIKGTSSEASWITSILGYSGVLSCLILPIIFQKFGRKAVTIFKDSALAIGWIVCYYAKDIPSLYISRLLQGLTLGGAFINLIIIGEYVDPGRRGYFTVTQKVAHAVGTLFCHAMTLWLTWRQVAAFALIPAVLSVLLVFLWPESPFFLAMTGRYGECERSFHWLNGTHNRNSELNELISAQKERVENEKYDTSTKLKIWQVVTRREFVKPFSITMFLFVAVDLCGRNYFKAYIVQIMTDLTGDKSNGIYIAVLADCIVIAALILSTFVIKRFPRRRLIFTGGLFSVLIIFSISLVLFLRNKNYVYISSWVSPCLILLLNFVTNVTFIPAAFAIAGEIYPLHLKGLGCCLGGIVVKLSYGVVLKVTPVLMEIVALEGTYVIYGSGMIMCLLILYFILPETKDKTLMHVENQLRGSKTVGDREMTLLKVGC